MKANWNLLSDSDQIRGLKLICIALPAGVILFSFIAVFVSIDSTPIFDDSFLLVPRIAHLLVTLAAIVAQKFLYDRIIAGKLSMQTDTQPIVARYRVATIVSLALYEGSALFGLVIILNASTGGMLKTDITLYLHLIPVLLLIGAAWSCYPTEQKMSDLLRLYPN
jgi:F0F1-type ATP synthase membrane subunit c/vacuolar-type H+-ATPase subunit K